MYHTSRRMRVPAAPAATPPSCGGNGLRPALCQATPSAATDSDVAPAARPFPARRRRRSAKRRLPALPPAALLPTVAAADGSSTHDTTAVGSDVLEHQHSAARSPGPGEVSSSCKANGQVGGGGYDLLQIGNRMREVKGKAYPFGHFAIGSLNLQGLAKQA